MAKQQTNLAQKSAVLIKKACIGKVQKPIPNYRNIIVHFKSYQTQTLDSRKLQNWMNSISTHGSLACASARDFDDLCVCVNGIGTRSGLPD